MANEQRPADDPTPPDPANPTSGRNAPVTDTDDGMSKPRPGQDVPGQGEHPNPGKRKDETLPNELLPGD
ncbi:hypothetical protein NVV94_10890 [Pseudomonas sp. LS1212]|uniref:hypothetical protein n=1 Tax=Pseudomonas sp. LS1212 TaxID=2972478 RepID=UPI00215D0CB3|nr:hypothetical protein [Pseudomonas sp. LS1212]UVJ45998.1 hypothetical protein NVV94_10890 [Pseudomonas sp. LS1212]